MIAIDPSAAGATPLQAAMDTVRTAVQHVIKLVEDGAVVEPRSPKRRYRSLPCDGHWRARVSRP